MSGYRIRIWCEDCTGQDSLGCYDGRSWWAIDNPRKDEQDINDATVFATREAAEAAADELDGPFPPWNWEIVEAQ